MKRRSSFGSRGRCRGFEGPSTAPRPSLPRGPAPTPVREGRGEEGRGGEGHVGSTEIDVVGGVDRQSRQVFLECGEFGACMHEGVE